MNSIVHKSYMNHTNRILDVVDPLYNTYAASPFTEVKYKISISKSHTVLRTSSGEFFNVVTSGCEKKILNDWLHATCPARKKFQELGVSIHKIILDSALNEEIVVVQNEAQ